MEDYKKKYEEAIFRMNKWVEGSEIIDPKEIAEFIFPELKESEDERIRKEIVYYLDREIALSNFGRDIATLKKWITWLEKQGEQTPIDAETTELNALAFLTELGYTCIPPRKQMPAWSEEDEEMFDAVIADIQFTQKAHTHDDNQVVYEREIDWLKSIKERMKGE